MSRWQAAFARSAIVTPVTPDDTCAPHRPQVSQGVQGVTGPNSRETHGAVPEVSSDVTGVRPSPAGDMAPLVLLPPSPEQAEAERQDRAAIAAEGAPVATVPLDAGTLAAWEAELAELLAAAPAQRITDPEKAAAYFAAEARRRLAHVRHDRWAAGLLMGFWRHARGRMT